MSRVVLWIVRAAIGGYGTLQVPSSEANTGRPLVELGLVASLHTESPDFPGTDVGVSPQVRVAGSVVRLLSHERDGLRFSDYLQMHAGMGYLSTDRPDTGGTASFHFRIGVQLDLQASYVRDDGEQYLRFGIREKADNSIDKWDNAGSRSGFRTLGLTAGRITNGALAEVSVNMATKRLLGTEQVAAGTPDTRPRLTIDASVGRRLNDSWLGGLRIEYVEPGRDWGTLVTVVAWFVPWHVSRWSSPLAPAGAFALRD